MEPTSKSSGIQTSIFIERLDADAQEADFDEIVSIQAQLAILPSLIKSGAKESSTGFLISGYQRADLMNFVHRGGVLLAARQNKGGQIVGYLLANSGSTFLANHPTTQLDWENDPWQSRYGEAYRSGGFMYLDQIGVARDFHGKGVAQALHVHFRRSCGTAPILAAVIQSPIRNARSTAFFKKLGYQEVGMFYTAELKGLRDVRSAVLLLDASSTLI